MPQTVVPNLYTPSDSDVNALLKYVKGTHLKTAICLTAFGPLGRIVPLSPDSIKKRFINTIKLLDIPHFLFHDLRHYVASILHAIGIPDQYIIERGGWSTDNVMKTIYRGAINEESKKMNHKINEHFESMQHENKKA